MGFSSSSTTWQSTGMLRRPASNSLSSSPSIITWLGDGITNNWDAATLNFTSNLGPTAFASGDAVTINDTGSNTPTIKIVGTLAPASLIVKNTSKNFTLQGTGSLAATNRFTKSGTGTVTISNTGPNTFTAATLEGGAVSLTTANALGTGPITFSAGSLLFSADQSNAFVIDGTVAINPSGSRTMNGTWSGAGTINLTNTGSNLLTLGGSMANFTGDVSLGTSTGSVRLYGNTGSSTTTFNLGSSTVTLFTRNGGSPHDGSRSISRIATRTIVSATSVSPFTVTLTWSKVGLPRRAAALTVDQPSAGRPSAAMVMPPFWSASCRTETA